MPELEVATAITYLEVTDGPVLEVVYQQPQLIEIGIQGPVGPPGANGMGVGGPAPGGGGGSVGNGGASIGTLGATIYYQNLIGIINGVNLLFTTPTPATGIIAVAYNGLEGSTYTFTPPNQIRLDDPPYPTDVVAARYIGPP